MKRKLVVLTVAIVGLAKILNAQNGAQEKTAGEVMKNVQVLKGVPISEWNDTMNVMGGALGVGCGQCHGAAFEKDDLKSKLTARSMIKMTQEINAADFGGRPEVTCHTCHQGSLRPKSMSDLWAKSAVSAPPAAHAPGAAPSNASALPDVDHVMASYRTAVGPDVKSIHLRGTVEVGNPVPIPFEIDLGLPDKVALTASTPGGKAMQVFNGDRGWISTGGAVNDLTPENMAGGKLLINSIRPVKFATSATPQKVTGIEKMGDRTLVVVESRSDKRLERLYFDTQSGLLYKWHAEVQTTLGRAPSEIVFEDYRDVNGTKLPYLMTIHTTSNQANYKFSEIQVNAVIDPVRFEKPPM